MSVPERRPARRRPPRHDAGALDSQAVAPPQPAFVVAASRPLASVPMLLGFAAGLVGLIAVVFPTRAEYASLAQVQQPDQYSIAYLRVLTRANPEDTALRLLYVRQLAQLGRWQESLEALGPALQDPTVQNEARLLRFDIHLKRARALPEPSKERAQAFEDAAALLPDLLAQDLSLVQLRDLATVALALDKPGLGADIYARVASLVPETERHGTRALAARWYLAAGDYPAAARYYAWAATTAPTVEDAKTYALAELSALEQKSVEVAADRSVAYAKRWWDDQRVVERATRLATSCDRPRTARDFGRRLLAIGPVTEALQRDQAKRELAAGDSKAALAIIQQLLVAHPEDCALHEAHAILSEWAGDNDAALDHWFWLADHACALKGVVL